MSNNTQPQYKRGTIIKNGKRYGFYPDGSLYPSSIMNKKRSNRKDLIRMKWREDDTIRFYRDVPDKRGVSEMVINTPSYPAYSIISGNVAYVLLPL